MQKKINILLALIFGLFGLFFMNPILADQSSSSSTSPVATLNSAADEMISALAKNKAKLKSAEADPIINKIVNQILIPHIDFDHMAGAVLGRQYWIKATPDQKQAFIREFTHLVTSTYAAALASYDDDRVQFYPLRENYSNLNSVTVNSVVIRKSGQKIPISYNLIRRGNTWKVYDYNIENVSMSQSYRSQFSDQLAQSGMAGLIQRLAEHNRGKK